MGICSVHRAEILQLRGDWSDALDEASARGERCLGINSAGRGRGVLSAGRGAPAARRARGGRGGLSQRQPVAAAIPSRAVAAQAGPGPDRCRGGVRSAARWARRRTRSQRTGLLAAQVEIMLASGDIDEARVRQRRAGGRSPHASTRACWARWRTTPRARSSWPEGNPLAGPRLLRRAWQGVAGAQRALPGRAGARAAGAVLPRPGRRRRQQAGAAAARAAFEQLGRAPDLARLDARPRGARRGLPPARADRAASWRSCAWSPPARPTRRSRPRCS